MKSAEKPFVRMFSTLNFILTGQLAINKVLSKQWVACDVGILYKWQNMQIYFMFSQNISASQG